MSTEKVRILCLSVNSYSFFYDQLVIPFGLISIASYVESEEYEIKGIEMNDPPEKTLSRYLKLDKELMGEIIDFSPDIVAMSTYASNMYNVLFWAENIKKELPNCLIIIGGNHASYIAKECVKKHSGVDIVVRFEGEIPFKMICEKVKNKSRDFSDIPSLTYKSNEKVIETPQIEFIKDLGSLPFLNRDLFRGREDSNNITHADIITARGCPHNCTFCNCNHYWSKTYRVQLIDNIIKELEYLQESYPNLKSVRIRDESVTINKHRCKKLCDALVSNNISLQFQAHSRLDGLDEEVISNLSKANFKLIFIGMESGSQEVLNRLKKGINISRAEEVISLLRKYGLYFRIAFMSETPHEKVIDTLKTIKLIKKLHLAKNEYYIGKGIAIYPGTTECDRFLKQNPDYEWLSKKYNFKGKYRPVFDMKGNIIHPYYLECSFFRRNLFQTFIELSLNPFNILNYCKEGVKSLSKRIVFLLKSNKTI